MRPFRYWLFWLLLGWVGVGLLVYLSLTSTPIRTTLAYGDKLGHLGGYALLMAWFVQIYQRRAWLLLHAILLLVLGVSIEFLQELNGRYFEIADMVANGIGILLGFLVVLTPLREMLLRLERHLIH